MNLNSNGVQVRPPEQVGRINRAIRCRAGFGSKKYQLPIFLRTDETVLGQIIQDCAGQWPMILAIVF